MDKNTIKRTYITEKELVDIFQEQYNDIFSEILKIDQFNFFKLLEKQVLCYLEITKKYSPQTLLKKVQKNFVKKYLEEKGIVSKDYEQIQNTQKVQLDYLDKLNCIIHCPKSKNALHTCGFPFIVYGNYVYCLGCKKVYNEQQVNMYCDNCDVEYYTKLREVSDKQLENYFMISISNYHCKIENEEKLKCPKCDKELYADILNINNSGKIEKAFCIYCHLYFNLKLFNFKCKQCGKHFISEAKIFNEFYNKKNDLICKVHALVNKKYIGPVTLLNKACDCNLNNIIKYKHNDGGMLLEGDRSGQKVIICDKCYNMYNYYDYLFSCPICNKTFNSNKNNNNNEDKNNESENQSNNSNKDLKYNKKNGTFVERRIVKRRNVCISKEHHSNKDVGVARGECSSSNKNKKTKNVTANALSAARAKMLKENNSKTKVISSSKNVSKTYRENGKDVKSCNKRLEQAFKINNEEDDNQNNNNMNIQNFYNNYAPIIHILENNQKKLEKTDDLKMAPKSNSNYKLIHTSPKIKKKTNNIIHSSKYLPNSLKRSITENTKFNLGLGHASLPMKKNENNNDQIEIYDNINGENKKGININLNTQAWNNNKKRLSASFTVVSSSNKNSSNNAIEYQVNTSPMNTEASTREAKKRNSAESEKVKTIIEKTKIPKNEIFNINKDTKNIILEKVNPIKEINEEYQNEIKELKIKKPKYLLKFETTGNSAADKLNNSKRIKKLIISSSQSEEKHKKIQKQKTLNERAIYNDKDINVKKNNDNETENNIENTIKVRPKTKINVNLNNNLKNKNNVISLGNKQNEGDETKVKKMVKNNTNKNTFKERKKIVKDFNSDDYNILNMLGEGTFSQIFLVENIKTHEKFALKKMTATKMEDLEEKKKEFEFILKLTSENDKLNLVKIFGTQMKKLDKFNLVLYILMEAANSDWETELKNRHYSKDFYTEDQLKNILFSLVQTFAILQKKGISHRDVKPQNILCFGNGVYKITDFGEAKANQNSIFEKSTLKFNFCQDTSVQTIRGTELYMSPILFNALRNSNVEDLQYNAYKSDVFSLGLCFLLSGCLSYRPLSELRDLRDNSKIKVLIEKYFKDRYSKKFVEVINSMLQLDEKDRPDFIELENMIKKNLL